MLTLPIKKKWFRMIQSGEKKEEYRDITPYYEKRFQYVKDYPDKGEQKYYVRLRAGYRHDSPKMTIECWIDTGEGKPEWGAEPGKLYYRLHITGKIIEKAV